VRDVPSASWRCQSQFSISIGPKFCPLGPVLDSNVLNLACLPPTPSVQGDGKLLRFLQNGSRMQLNTATEMRKERKHLKTGESLGHGWDPFLRNKNCRILSKYGTTDGRAKILSCHKPPQKKFGKAGGNAHMWNAAGVCGSHSTILVSL
jgi:hypothetical protein